MPWPKAREQNLGGAKGFSWNMEISFIICANVAIGFLSDTLYMDAIWWPEWDIKVLAISPSPSPSLPHRMILSNLLTLNWFGWIRFDLMCAVCKFMFALAVRGLVSEVWSPWSGVHGLVIWLPMVCEKSRRGKKIKKKKSAQPICHWFSRPFGFIDGIICNATKILWSRLKVAAVCGFLPPAVSHHSTLEAIIRLKPFCICRGTSVAHCGQITRYIEQKW